MSQPFDREQQAEQAPQRKPPAEWFEKMAELIKNNAGQDFGGAFVLVPPGDDQEPMFGLILSNDKVQFWGTVQAKVQIRLQEMDMNERRTVAFGR